MLLSGKNNCRRYKHENFEHNQRKTRYRGTVNSQLLSKPLAATELFLVPASQVCAANRSWNFDWWVHWWAQWINSRAQKWLTHPCLIVTSASWCWLNKSSIATTTWTRLASPHTRLCFLSATCHSFVWWACTHHTTLHEISPKLVFVELKVGRLHIAVDQGRDQDDREREQKVQDKARIHHAAGDVGDKVSWSTDGSRSSDGKIQTISMKPVAMLYLLDRLKSLLGLSLCDLNLRCGYIGSFLWDSRDIIDEAWTNGSITGILVSTLGTYDN